MRKTGTSLLAALALVGGATAPAVLAAEVAPGPAPAPAPAVVPPALQSLEQKMAAIRFNTARISQRSVIGEVGAPTGAAELAVGGKGHGALTLTSGLISHSPKLASAANTTESFSGSKRRRLASTTKERMIGQTTYTYLPLIAHIDGGRPWVRGRAVSASQSEGELGLFASEVALLEPALSGPPNEPFAKLIDSLDHAVSIREGGPVTVDGQQTTEFYVSLSVVQRLAGTISPKQLTKLEREIRKSPAEANVELDVFIAPDGLPVRTIGIGGAGSEAIGIEQDILALGVPVVVHAPPARETIGELRLLKIEERIAKRAHRRRSRHVHG
ncbi:MAG TPA: hypothetical protein VMU32_05290 [Solirubrobacteraceae bacterium]|nr:hypothetical protein [Solirubrobacteraceae bacterium]